ncbi:hypothetical protein ACR3GA_004323, partial [Shigella flexneri]
FGLIFRRSEECLHLIPTSEGQGENGDIGPLRPFTINLRTGEISMSHKVSVGGGSQVNGALGIGVQNALGGNSIVLGDNDTGFKQNGDGILDVYANSQRVFRWICPYISRHLLSLNPLQARCRRYSRGER